MHDVFISYKSEDAAIAMRVTNMLEENGIKCWIAERDISAGSNYAADIPSAIAQCKVLVLILTNTAQGSPWIMKELDSAIAGHKLILPMKIGYFDVSGAMSFLLTGVQYYDATTYPDETMKSMVYRIRQAIANNEGGDHKKSKKLKVRKSHGGLFFLISIAVLFAGLHYFEVIDIKTFLSELLEILKQLPDNFVKKFEELITSLTEILNAG